MSAEEAFARCKFGIEQVLGGVVNTEQPYESLEASFGLVHSERLTCSLIAIDAARTRVTIETRRGVQRDAPPSSYVSELARYLSS